MLYRFPHVRETDRNVMLWCGFSIAECDWSERKGSRRNTALTSVQRVRGGQAVSRVTGLTSGNANHGTCPNSRGGQRNTGLSPIDLTSGFTPLERAS